MSLECELAHGDSPGRCSWCGHELVGRRRRWCSDGCSDAFLENHVWNRAREAAREREGFRCAEGCDVARLHVHHRRPVLDRGGYALGCQHHLEGSPVVAGDLRLAVKREVAEQCANAAGVVLEHAEGCVALTAEDSPNVVGGVVVIYMRDDFAEASLADGTRVPLVLEHLAISGRVKAIDVPEVASLRDATAGAIEGVGSGDALGVAHQTSHGFFADAAAIARLAANRAVEPGPPLGLRDRDAALEAGVGDRTTIEGAVSSPPGIVQQAEATCLVVSGPFAADQSAEPVVSCSRHSVLIVVVPATELPPPRMSGGLVTLCEAHHRAEHRFMREVELLVAWADGSSQRQLVLPGIAA